MKISLTDLDPTMETVMHQVDVPDLDLTQAKEIAKHLANDRCNHPMILSWKNGTTGEFYPTVRCGKTEKPAWIHYAETRGANLTVDINNGAYIFMILKI